LIGCHYTHIFLSNIILEISGDAQSRKKMRTKIEIEGVGGGGGF
jgi:hypothetical protein